MMRRSMNCSASLRELFRPSGLISESSIDLVALLSANRARLSSECLRNLMFKQQCSHTCLFGSPDIAFRVISYVNDVPSFDSKLLGCRFEDSPIRLEPSHFIRENSCIKELEDSKIGKELAKGSAGAATSITN